MIKEIVTPTTPEVKAEKLMAEIRDFIRGAILNEITLKDAGELLIKIDNWENGK